MWPLCSRRTPMPPTSAEMLSFASSPNAIVPPYVPSACVQRGPRRGPCPCRPCVPALAGGAADGARPIGSARAVGRRRRRGAPAARRPNSSRCPAPSGARRPLHHGADRRAPTACRLLGRHRRHRALGLRPAAAPCAGRPRCPRPPAARRDMDQRRGAPSVVAPDGRRAAPRHHRRPRPRAARSARRGALGMVHDGRCGARRTRRQWPQYVQDAVVVQRPRRLRGGVARRGGRVATCRKNDGHAGRRGHRAAL